MKTTTESISARTAAQLVTDAEHSGASAGPSSSPPAGGGGARGLSTAAAERLFVPMASQPTTADAIAQYQLAMSMLTASNAVERASAMHAQSLADNPDLAALLRTAEVCDAIADLVGSAAVLTNSQLTWKECQDAAAAGARRAYQIAIARQLGGPDARAFIDAVEAEERAIAEAVRREAAAQAELERQAEAQRVARNAELAGLREKIDDAARAERAARAAVDDATKAHLQAQTAYVTAALAGRAMIRDSRGRALAAEHVALTFHAWDHIDRDSLIRSLVAEDEPS